MSRDRPEAANTLEARVIDYAYMGDLTLYKLGLPSGRTIKASTPNAGWDATPITWDEDVFVSFPAEAGVILTE